MQVVYIFFLMAFGVLLAGASLSSIQGVSLFPTWRKEEREREREREREKEESDTEKRRAERKKAPQQHQGGIALSNLKRERER